MVSTSRQRKLEVKNGAKPSSSEKKFKVKPCGTKVAVPRALRQCLFVGSIACLLTLLIGFQTLTSRSIHKTSTLDHLAKKLGLHKNLYAVIIDAGSTGSRVVALSFFQSRIDESLKLDKELFFYVKPGLSSFADSPKDGANRLKELLVKARDFIPEECWEKTPLVMRATAGLRLLPSEKAESLLQEVRQMFAASPFLTNEHSVAIMDGIDEGLYSWFTVNFLNDLLSGDLEKTMAALDLGGGSTQITFVPNDASRLQINRPQYLHSLSLMHHNISIYSHSYLGLGLMAARKEILSVGNVAGETQLRSECINPIIAGAKWTYGEQEYYVYGPSKAEMRAKKIHGGGVEQVPVVRTEECSRIVLDYVLSLNVDQPEELLRSHTITAFSYYYDRAAETGLIDPYKGGILTVKQFQQKAVEVCNTPNAEQPFMCLDMTFISILLHHGYGLPSLTELQLIKKLDGHEVSWSLGLAYHILESGKLQR